MNLSHQIFNQLLIMMIIAVFGFIFAKCFNVEEKEEKFLSKLLLYFINPCLIFNSFNVPFDKNKLIGLVFSIVLSFVITFVMIFFAQILYKKKTSINQIQKLAVVFTNCGFIGIPLITTVYGGEGVFYLMGYLVSFNVMLWVYGYYQMAGKTNIKKIITNPNIIAVVAGLILFVSPYKLPSMITKPISMIGSLNTAISMILLGILFGQLKKEWMIKLFNTVKSFFSLSKDYSTKRYKVISVILTSLVRLILFGFINLAICYFVLNLCKNHFSFLETKMIILICSVVLIASLCPTGISVSSLSCLFNKDAVFANFLVCFTHVLCIFTIPFVLNIFLYLVL